MGMEGSMGPPGSQNNMGPSSSESSMYSPSRYSSQQRSAPVCSGVCLHDCALVWKVKTMLKNYLSSISLLHPLVCFRHDGYSQQYPTMPYGMHPSGMYPQQQVSSYTLNSMNRLKHHFEFYLFIYWKNGKSVILSILVLTKIIVHVWRRALIIRKYTCGFMNFWCQIVKLLAAIYFFEFVVAISAWFGGTVWWMCHVCNH